MRYVLLIYTNEADRPAWGTPEGGRRGQGVRGIPRRGHPAWPAEWGAAAARRRGQERARPDGKAQVSDGPAVQTAEQLGGYYLVDGKDLDEALELAAKVPGARYGTIEVRPVLEFA